jgi:plastocyanin
LFLHGGDHNNYAFDVSDLDAMAGTTLTTVKHEEHRHELEMYRQQPETAVGHAHSGVDERQSRFFKFVMPEHVNRGVQDREYK